MALRASCEGAAEFARLRFGRQRNDAEEPQERLQPPQRANVRRQQETDIASRAGQNEQHVHERHMVADQQRAATGRERYPG